MEDSSGINNRGRARGRPRPPSQEREQPPARRPGQPAAPSPLHAVNPPPSQNAEIAAAAATEEPGHGRSEPRSFVPSTADFDKRGKQSSISDFVSDSCCSTIFATD